MAQLKLTRKTKKGSDSKKTNRNKAGIIIGAVCAVLVILLGFAIYVKAYDSKVLPNIYIGGVAIGGLTQQEAQDQLYSVSRSASEGNVKVSVNDKEYQESASTLNLDYDINKTAKKAYLYGHSGEFWSDTWHSLRALFGKVTMLPELLNPTKQVEAWVETIALEADDPYQNANIEVENDTAYIVDPKDGMQINKVETVDRILTEFSNFNEPNIVVERQATYPAIQKEDAQSLVEEAKNLVAEPLVLSINNQKFTAYPNTLGKWIELKVDEDGNTYMSFSSGEISSYLETEIAPVANEEPVDAKFTFSNGSVSVLKESQNGKILNIESATESIIQTLEKGSNELVIPMEEQLAQINEEVVSNVSKYGIKELIGTGTTNFSGSPSNRKHNIETGARFLNGIILVPGEEFSTIGHLGSIDGSSGYLEELVIKEDKTEPEFGGGLCQVSTTLFRAAMNAGLEITERANHSYRVSYYEPPVGMDATIYSPRPDLKFVNNTDNYILIQSSVSGNNITFNFFGTSDGRRVEISDPETYDETPPGDTIYVDDDSLEPGEEKYLEHAHPGIKAVFYYKVFNSDGSIKLEQTFKSNYVPWPARIARGPEKEPEEAEGQE